MWHLQGEGGGELDDNVGEGVDAEPHGGCRQVQQRLGGNQAKCIFRGHDRPLYDRDAQQQPQRARRRQVHQSLNCTHKPASQHLWPEYRANNTTIAPLKALLQDDDSASSSGLTAADESTHRPLDSMHPLSPQVACKLL